MFYGIYVDFHNAVAALDELLLPHHLFISCLSKSEVFVFLCGCTNGQKWRFYVSFFIIYTTKGNPVLHPISRRFYGNLRFLLVLRPLLYLVLITFLLNMAGCTHVPVTGRSQLTLVPDYQLLAMSEREYKRFLSKHKLCTDPAKVAMVRRVGSRISEAVERFLAERGQIDRIKGYDWEFNLVCGKEINAFCMPGGKVVVYSGLLPVAKDENGLAVVLGHEIAHAVANHAAERLSQALLLQLGGDVLSMVTGSYNPATRRLLMQLYGLGANVGVLLPYSRTQEYEADHLGLIFMAMAGYDPRGALTFWKRMMAVSKNKPRPPQILSTHPADRARLQRIIQYMPEALQYYRRYLYEHGMLYQGAR